MGLELKPRPGLHRCPYCHDSAVGGLVACACGARFHKACAAALGVCSTLGCGRDVGPVLRVLASPSGSGWAPAVAGWGGALLLAFAVLGSLPLFRSTNCRCHDREHSVWYDRGARTSAPRAPAPAPALAPTSVQTTATFEDQRLTIAALAGKDTAGKLVASDLVLVQVRVQNLARGPATVCLHREQARFRWEWSGLDQEWVAIDLPGCCREGWSPISDDDFSRLEPGEWITLVRPLHRSSIPAGPSRIRLCLELEPSSEVLKLHLRSRASSLFAPMGDDELASLRARLRGSLGGTLVSNELALGR